MLLFLGPGAGDGVVRGPNPWLAYVLVGDFCSGSGAHESTGRWSEGSTSEPSKRVIGREASYDRPRVDEGNDAVEAPLGEAGMWYGLCGLLEISRADVRALGL